MSFINLKNVVKVYPDGTQAIFNSSLSIEKGELVVFVGPSGCGKSTLLRMIAGLEDVTEGEIDLDGNRINEIASLHHMCSKSINLFIILIK